jgi:tetratricopeptide (TPR) repeat protein
MPAPANSSTVDALRDVRLAFVGKLAGMPRREAQQLARSQGAVVLDKLDETAQLIVVGEDGLPLDEVGDALDDAVRQAVERGDARVITETELWQRLGFVEGEQNIHRLYTPAMLAELLSVPIAIIRRWHRRGLIVPARQVRKLPYFDFCEIATARRLAELLSAGVSPQAIEKKLALVSRLLPGVERPLAQLSVIVEGKNLLLRQGEGLIEPGGQLRLNFTEQSLWEPGELESLESDATLSIEPITSDGGPHTPDELREMAATLEETGQLSAAADMYRASLAAGGPNAEVCFLLAELLYRLGDVSAAQERYYMAVELDEDYVEARANLGCTLAETGQHELAAAAFEGALQYHPEYADVHYHLALTLDELKRPAEAEEHWREFLALSPDSPWAATARERLGGLS